MPVEDSTSATVPSFQLDEVASIGCEFNHEKINWFGPY